MLRLLLIILPIFLFKIPAVLGQMKLPQPLQQKVDSLKRALAKNQHDTTSIALLYELGYELAESEPDTARFYFRKALAFSKEIKWHSMLPRIYNELGLIILNRGHFEQALLRFDSCLKTSIELDDSLMIAAAYDNSGTANIYLGNYVTATELRKKGLMIYQARNDTLRIANAYVWIGNVELSQGNYSNALKNFLEALRIGEETKNMLIIAYAKASCASVYRHQEEYEKALEYHTSSLSVFKKRDMKREVATVHFNIGHVYHDQGKDKLALENYRIALEIRSEIKDSSGIGGCYNSIGNVHKAQGDFVSAKKYYWLASRIAQQIGERRKEGIALTNLGDNESMEGHFDAANKYLLQGLHIGNELGDKEIKAYCYEKLSVNHEKQGDYKSALENFKLYKEVADSIKEETKSKNVLELQALYDTEKITSENTQLKSEQATQRQLLAEADRDKAIRERALAVAEQDRVSKQRENEKLRAENQAKELDLLGKKQEAERLRADSLANQIIILEKEEELKESERARAWANVLIVAIFLVLAVSFYFIWWYRRNKKQREEMLDDLKHATTGTLPEHADKLEKAGETVTDRQSKKLLTHLAYQTRAIASLYDILYGNYKGNRTIAIDVFIEELISKHKARWPIEKEVRMNMDIIPNTIPLKDARTHGLILNEFMNNSFKYAFPGDKQPDFTIKLFPEDKKITFYLKDNGVGYPEPIKQLMSSDSQGLDLIKSHTERLGGKVKFYNHPDGGAVCEITGIKYRKIPQWLWPK